METWAADCTRKNENDTRVDTKPINGPAGLHVGMSSEHCTHTVKSLGSRVGNVAHCREDERAGLKPRTPLLPSKVGYVQQ